MEIVVLKFGGSSLGDKNNLKKKLDRIYCIAKSVKEKNKKIVIIVSALYKRTRELQFFGEEIGLKSNTQEMDSLLSIGEEESSSIISGYFKEIYGLKTDLFLRKRLPIKTDGVYGDSKIIDIDTEEIISSLEKDQVPIIPGYIGFSNENNITTLGFDGSDTTAVAMAKYIGAKSCYFYKDVFGIYSANPFRVENAKKYDQLGLNEMFTFSQLGGKVLHTHSIEMAIESNIELHVLSYNEGNGDGTKISRGCSRLGVMGITYLNKGDFYMVSVIGKDIKHNREIKKITEILHESYILIEGIKTQYSDESVSIKIKWKEQLEIVLKILHEYYGLDKKNVGDNIFYGKEDNDALMDRGI